MDKKWLPLSGIIEDEYVRERNKRRDLIKDIQDNETIKSENGKLIVYTANFNHPNSSMQHADITPFEELLIDVGHTSTLFLMIDSPGGDPNIAEKLLIMCRERCDCLKVIVPNTAKSAATLMTLGCDEILMGHLSELGPIDPQISIISPEGIPVYVPAQSVIDGFKILSEGLRKTSSRESLEDPRAYLQILSRLDPPTYDRALKAQKLTEEFARVWLTQYMCKHSRQKADKIVNKLSDAKEWLSHGRAIDADKAMNLLGKNDGLNVKKLSKDDDLWKLIWELYVLSERHLQLTKRAKLCESENVSIHQ
jgi:ClpP class serine protease